MPSENESGRSDEHAQAKSARNTVLGLFVLWGFATWQLMRALLWNVVFSPFRLLGSDRMLALDPEGFWIAICAWMVVGPIFMIGTATFMWIQRNDHFE